MAGDSIPIFDMYRAMRAQPDAIAQAVERAHAAVGETAARIGAASRVLLVGIGTSLHAAQAGQRLFRDAGCEAWAVHSFDFALSGPVLHPTDAVIVVSHRGTKQYSGRALQRARDAGACTVVISGEGGAADDAADLVLRTAPQEASSAHTVSYTTAVAVLATLATAVARVTGAPLVTEDDFLRGPLTAAVQSALDGEDAIRDLAARHASHRRIWISGGGMDAVTAAEAALKIKETSYSQAEGMQVEAFLHGPFCAVERDDLFVVLASDNPARPRVAQLADLIGALGAPLVVADSSPAEPIGPASAARLVVPAAPGGLAAITGIVPLQLFAYHVALQRGTNPDSFRADDPGFPQIMQHVQL